VQKLAWMPKRGGTGFFGSTNETRGKLGKRESIMRGHRKRGSRVGERGEEGEIPAVGGEPFLRIQDGETKKKKNQVGSFGKRRKWALEKRKGLRVTQEEGNSLGEKGGGGGEKTALLEGGRAQCFRKKRGGGKSGGNAKVERGGLDKKMWKEKARGRGRE